MTIAQQLKITSFPFIITDHEGREIYLEHDNGEWCKRAFNSRFCTFFESSDGFWGKYGYDENGYLIYKETSTQGVVIDRRPKTEIQKAIELLTKEGLLVDGKILKN